MIEKTPLSTGACCRPQASGLTYLHVGPDKHPVGMMNLEVVFRQLLLLEHGPEMVSSGELLGMARRFNYIPRKPEIEAEYAGALRQAYAQYCARQMAARGDPGAAESGRS
jgi:hypothetical protein